MLKLEQVKLRPEQPESELSGKAAQLLRETDDTVQNISVQVGFANFGTFYKAFKREFGVAPGKFRAG